MTQMNKNLFYLILLSLLLSSFGCGDSSGNEESQSLPTTSTDTDTETETWSGTQQLGTPNSDEVFGVATDSSGNVYVAGQTQGEMDGNINAGFNDIFLQKYNSSGTKQ